MCRQVLDQDKDGFVEFPDFVFGFDIMCFGSVEQKLKLFYYMHLDEPQRCSGEYNKSTLLLHKLGANFSIKYYYIVKAYTPKLFYAGVVLLRGWFTPDLFQRGVGVVCSTPGL